MKIITMNLGELDTSCYIVVSDSGNAAVIDPADNAEHILDVLGKNSLTLKLILLTHGHFDHTGAAAELKEQTGAKVYIHKADECMLDDRQKNVSYLLPGFDYKSFAADVTVDEGDTVTLDEITFTVIHTPGHTAGSIMFTADNAIFSGDTIFEGSVGRTDFYSGSPAQQRQSLQRIMNMDGDFDIYPGHGGKTTLSAEKRHNPYLLYLDRL
ncbi:MAG: MBL fold metallo-hydrolase [Eubacterium sp.]|nr:MBL fold metallo-hydrolase [Eubacterium sp.]